jgi:hypothetical protein
MLAPLWPDTNNQAFERFYPYEGACSQGGVPQSLYS